MKNRLIIGAALAILGIGFAGCARTSGMSGPPGAESGAGRSQSAMRGEHVPTETLTPAVNSALFPEPNWR